MTDKELESLLIKRLVRRPRNIKQYVKIVRLSEDKTLTTSQLQELSELSSATFYRIYRELRDADCLYGAIYSKAKADVYIPEFISDKTLPPPEFEWVHLAAYLNRYRDEETVPPYGKTKQEIRLELSKKFKTDPEAAADLVFGIQSRLAIYAIMMDKLEGFNNMVGNLVVPNTLPVSLSVAESPQ